MDCCSERLNNADVFIYDGESKKLCGNTEVMYKKAYKKIICPEILSGNSLKIEVNDALSLCEVDVFGGFSLEVGFFFFSKNRKCEKMP